MKCKILRACLFELLAGKQTAQLLSWLLKSWKAVASDEVN